MNEIQKIIRDCMSMPDEPNSVFVEFDSLQSLKGWVDSERAKAVFERIVEHVKQLPKLYLDAEKGWSFQHLNRLAAADGGLGQQWGTFTDAALLCILCAHYGIVQDPLKTLGFKEDSLNDLPNKMTYISFNVEPEFLDMVRHQLGITSVARPTGFLGGFSRLFR